MFPHNWSRIDFRASKYVLVKLAVSWSFHDYMFMISLDWLAKHKAKKAQRSATLLKKDPGTGVFL